MAEIDYLKLYRGDSVFINKYFSVLNPTINAIVDFGEQRHYSTVNNMCAVGADLKWQLDDIGIEYDQIDDYDLFVTYIAKSLSKEDTKLILGDVIDFQSMRLEFDEDLSQYRLIQHVITSKDIKIEEGSRLRKWLSFYMPFLKKTTVKTIEESYDIVFDKYCYYEMVKAIRSIYGFKRNDEIAGNAFTKMMLIDMAREDYQLNKDKEFKSQLMTLVSALVNVGHLNKDEKTIFNMNVFAFMDSVKRISQIKNADVLLQSGYSGFGINLKEINKKELDWLTDIYESKE